MLGLRFCARAFSSCGKRGPLFIAVHGPLTIAASLVAEHRLQTHRLSNCGSRAQLLRGMWDLPRPGLEPVSPALAGGLSTTVPPGKPPYLCFKIAIAPSGLLLCLSFSFSFFLSFFWNQISAFLTELFQMTQHAGPPLHPGRCQPSEGPLAKRAVFLWPQAAHVFLCCTLPAAS